jgi:hypothetical protein
MLTRHFKAQARVAMVETAGTPCKRTKRFEAHGWPFGGQYDLGLENTNPIDRGPPGHLRRERL